MNRVLTGRSVAHNEGSQSDWIRFKILAVPEGLEPPTPSLGRRRSIL